MRVENDFLHPLFIALTKNDSRRVIFMLCPREESNLDYKIRNLASYPLNDKGKAHQPSEQKKPCAVYRAIPNYSSIARIPKSRQKYPQMSHQTPLREGVFPKYPLRAQSYTVPRGDA